MTADSAIVKWLAKRPCCPACGGDTPEHVYDCPFAALLTPPSETREIERLRAALERGIAWFEEYAAIHKRKGDADKQARNQSRADELRRALTATPEDRNGE